jgi:Baseplate J-like protein
MPITVPPIDRRRYDDLLAEAIARIAVTTPEWTNFNRSDPGITLVELFAFLTESLLYRANLIPERNRLAFLSLLGVPLQPAESARGLVTVANERGPLETTTLNGDLEVRAGQVPFRTAMGVDVLPVEARVYYKQPVPLSDELETLYRQLYASFLLDEEDAGVSAADLDPYQTVLLDGSDPAGVDLVEGTADGSLWVALLARSGDDPELARAALAGRTLSLGVVPVVADQRLTLAPVGTGRVEGEAHLEYAVPSVPEDGRLPEDPRLRRPRYRVLDPRPTDNVLLQPGVVQLGLPDRQGLRTWALDPIEAGVDQFPPAIEDSRLADRIVTWLRIRAQSATQARLLWVGINATPVVQRARVAGEVLPNGTGQPDQVVRLARPPVVPGSVQLTVTLPPTGSPAEPPLVDRWDEIEDLLLAGPEVSVADPRRPPGSPPPPAGPTRVFALDAEAGTVRFGDGLRGRRPPAGALLRATYDHGLGRAGNVGRGSINSGPALPAGFTVTNPVETWGGADAESVAEGEKQVARYLKHRDRLVNVEDFETIARRTPGVDLGRVEVLAAYDPQLAPNLPGGAPGAVTLMLVPRQDRAQPDAPSPDRFFLDAVCRYLDPRRLVTTELFLRGPDYVPIWISVGIEVVPGESIAEVQQRTAAELRRVLSPLPLELQQPPPVAAATPSVPSYPHTGTGWPLSTSVAKRELLAFVARVPGVRAVNGVFLAPRSDGDREEIELTGLELPRIAGISVVPGDPTPLSQLRGTAPGERPAPARVPVPVIPESC